jgi:hypothetical protein
LPPWPENDAYGLAVIAFLVSELATLRIAAAERSKPVPVTT